MLLHLLCFVLFMKMIHVSINLTEHGMEGGGLILLSRNVSFSGTTQRQYSDCEKYDFPSNKAIEAWS